VGNLAYYKTRNSSFLYGSPSVVRIVKSMIKYAGYVSRMEESRLHAEFWWENLLKDIHMEDRKRDGRIILRWVLGK